MRYVLVMMTMFTACNGYALVETAEESIGGRTQVGLAIEVDNGVATPLQVERGQTFYLNQIDLRASTTSTVDEGVSGLLNWDRVERCPSTPSKSALADAGTQTQNAA
jgi:hypothetical protein